MLYGNLRIWLVRKVRIIQVLTTVTQIVIEKKYNKSERTEQMES